MSPNQEGMTIRPNAVVFDVDGTLCDVRQIRHFVERQTDGPFSPDFARFHSASIDCPPHGDVVSLLRRADSAGYLIIIVTGREATWSFLTSRWLADHGIAYHEMLMRMRHDYRADATVKGEMVDAILGRYNVVLAVDDRDDILPLWSAAAVGTVKVSEEGRLGEVQWTTVSGPSFEVEQLVAEGRL